MEEDSAAVESQPAPDVDWMLQVLVNGVNATDIELGFTIMLGGTVVTGTLVSGSSFFEGWSKEMAGDDEVTRSQLALLGQEYRRTKDAPGFTAEQTQFIHLRDARFVDTGRMIPTDRGLWWRCRITRVDGFSVGRLGARSEADDATYERGDQP